MPSLIDRIFRRKPELEAAVAGMHWRQETPEPRQNSFLKASEGQGWGAPPGNVWNPYQVWSPTSFVPAQNLQAFGTYPQRQIAQAERLSTMNGIYHRILEIVRDHVYAKGFEVIVKAKTPALKHMEAAVKDACDKAFFEGANDLRLKLPDWIFEALMTGEMCLRAWVNPISGALRLGWIPARTIGNVDLNAFDYSEVLGVHVMSDPLLNPPVGMPGAGAFTHGGPEENTENRLEVIRYDVRKQIVPEPVAGAIYTKDTPQPAPVDNPNFGKLHGDVFFLKMGALQGQPRGQGIAYQLHDIITQLEQSIRDFQKRYEMQGAVVWDLEVQGKTQKELDAMGNIVLPVGRIPFLHNEKTKLTMNAPNIQISELTNLIRTFMVYVCGMIGVPEMLMGDGSMTNVATASEQTPALYAKFILIRSIIANFLSLIARYAVQEVNSRELLFENTGTPESPVWGQQRTLSIRELQQFDISVQFSEFERGEDKGTAATFTAVTSALQIAVTEQWVSNDAAGRVMRNILSQLGTSLDEEAEQTKLKAEKAMQAPTPSGNPSDKQDIAAVKQSANNNP